MEVCTSQIGEWNMNDGLISRKKAYEVLTDYYHQRTEIQHIALREALDRVPSADIDLSDYSDRLWRNAYEQGKAVSKDALDEAYAHGYTAAEADFHKQNQWIPVTERLPEEDYCTGANIQYSASVLMTVYNAEDEETIIDYGHTADGKWYSETTDCLVPSWWEVLAWMPLPECYRGDGNGE